MAKWKILLIMALVMVSIATALDICPDQIEISSNCTIITPHLNCTEYTYDIINTSSNGLIVSNSNLSLVDGGIYAFNFTYGKGEYIIRLCDETTRQVWVTDKEGKMIIAIIILIPLILGIIFLVGSATLGEEHTPLKIFLFLLSIITFFVSLHWGMLSVVRYFNFEPLEDAIGSTVYWFGLSFGVIITYFIIYLFYKLVHASAQKKEERMKY